jgi:hypothetical protein
MLTATDSGNPNAGGPITGQFEVTGQEPDIMVLSGNRVIKAETIYAKELTFGIDYQFTIPFDQYMGSGPEGAAGLRAEWLQALGNHEHVVGLYVSQDVNDQNLLRDYVFVTVGTEDLQHTAVTRILLDNANTPAAFTQIDLTWKTVAASAGLT